MKSKELAIPSGTESIRLELRRGDNTQYAGEQPSFTLVFE